MLAGAHHVGVSNESVCVCACACACVCVCVGGGWRGECACLYLMVAFSFIDDRATPQISHQDDLIKVLGYINSSSRLTDCYLSRANQSVEVSRT